MLLHTDGNSAVASFPLVRSSVKLSHSGYNQCFSKTKKHPGLFPVILPFKSYFKTPVY